MAATCSSGRLLRCAILGFLQCLVLARGRAGNCSEQEAAFVSTLINSPPVLRAVNDAMQGHLPRSFGDCSSEAAKSAAAQPCQPAIGFPLERAGSMMTWRADLVTQIDSLRVYNITTRCDIADAKSSRMFLQMDGGFSELALATHVSIKFPPMELDAPCMDDKLCLLDRHNVSLGVAARVRCTDHNELGLQVDPEYGIHLGNFAFEFRGFKVDIARMLGNILAALLEKVTIPCPEAGPTKAMCHAMCDVTQTVEAIAGEALSGEAAQAVSGTASEALSQLLV